MNLTKNIELLKKSLQLLRDPIHLAQPTLIVFTYVLSFYLVLWFVFADIINNALVDIVNVSKTLQADLMNIALQNAFTQSIWHLVYVMVWFIVVNYFLYSLFSSYLFKWIGEELNFKKKDGILLPFVIVTGFFALYSVIIGAPAARMSFLFPSSGQLLILTLAGFLILIALHFLLISYVQILKGKSWKESLLNGFSLGLGHLPIILFTYVIIGTGAGIVDIALRLVAFLPPILWAILAIFLFFPFLVVASHYYVSVIAKLK